MKTLIGSHPISKYEKAKKLFAIRNNIEYMDSVRTSSFS